MSSLRTVAEVQKLVDMCFQGNAILDNIVYELSVSPINAPRLADFIHHKLSHALPIKFADVFTDFMIERNDRIYRGSLNGDSTTYGDIVSCLKKITEVFEGINKQLAVAINIAIETDDKPVEDFLREFYVTSGTLYWRQAQTLRDASISFAEDNLLPLFNSNFKSYIIL